jgi:hypothetical protein
LVFLAVRRAASFSPALAGPAQPRRVDPAVYRVQDKRK